MRSLLATVTLARLLGATPRKRNDASSSSPTSPRLRRRPLPGLRRGLRRRGRHRLLCKSREFATAVSYRKVDKDEITGAGPTSTNPNCRGGTCDDYVAIVCTK